MDEAWRPIPGFEPWYEVSSLGRVRTWWRRTRWGNERRDEPRMASLVTAPGDYVRVHLCKDKTKYIRLVHRLVLHAFVAAPGPKQSAAHGDRDKHNNAVWNLRWVNQTENERDKVIHGTATRGERAGGAKATADQVVEIRRLVAPHAAAARGRQRARRGVYQEIAAVVHLPVGVVAKIARGERWTHVPA